MKFFKLFALGLGVMFISMVTLGLFLKTDTGSQLGPYVAKLSGKYKDRIILKNGLVLNLTGGWYSDAEEGDTIIILRKLNGDPFNEVGIRELPQDMNKTAEQNCSEENSKKLFELYKSAAMKNLSDGKIAFADTHKGFYDSLQIVGENFISKADLKWCETILMNKKQSWSIKLVSYVFTSDAGLILTYGFRSKKMAPESEKELVAEILSSVSQGIQNH